MTLKLSQYVWTKWNYLLWKLSPVLQRDSTIAKLLFSAVFEAIFAGRTEVKTERELDSVTEQINASLHNILYDSTLYYPPFIGCILVGKSPYIFP